MGLFKHVTILVRGGGDLASGVIYRLHRAGFSVIVTELPKPKLVRRTVSYGEAIWSNSVTIEGITAHQSDKLDSVSDILNIGALPVLVEPTKQVIELLEPIIVVDARMEKQPLDSSLDDAPLVVALGPGYVTGKHCHAVVETKRGHTLGRVIWDGKAQPDTSIPGTINAQTNSRVLRAPDSGFVQAEKQIGDHVRQGETIASINHNKIIAPFNGILRGLVHSEVNVEPGMKIGDLDPRANRDNCFTISDKALAIGGGVLEAVLSTPHIQDRLRNNHYETSPGV